MIYNDFKPCHQCGEPATLYTSPEWFCATHTPPPPRDAIARLCGIASWYAAYKHELSTEARAEIESVFGWTQ